MVYRYIGFNSLFRYAVDALQLTEAQAQAFITVARKAEQLPVLQEAIDKGDLTVSKAVRITSVIDEANQTEWVALAVRGSKRDVERAVAKENPRAVQPERTRFLNSHTVEIQVPINEAIFEKLERARDLVSQSTASAASIETTLNAVLDFYLERKDPLRKRLRDKKTKQSQMPEPKNMKSQETPADMEPPSIEPTLSDRQASIHSQMSTSTLPGQEAAAELDRNLEPTKTRPEQDTSHINQQQTLPTNDRHCPQLYGGPYLCAIGCSVSTVYSTDGSVAKGAGSNSIIAGRAPLEVRTHSKTLSSSAAVIIRRGTAEARHKTILKTRSRVFSGEDRRDA